MIEEDKQLTLEELIQLELEDLERRAGVDEAQ